MNVSDITVRAFVSIYNKNYSHLTSKDFKFFDTYENQYIFYFNLFSKNFDLL